MFSSSPLPFHTILLQKFPFKFRNSSNFLPPFPRTIYSIIMIDINKIHFKHYLVPASNNPHYADTEFRFRFEIQLRMYRNFVGEHFENIFKPTTNVPSYSVTKVPFLILTFIKFPSSIFKEEFIPYNDKYRPAIPRILSHACYQQSTLHCSKIPF
jgi:hypothetical protein